MAPNRVAEIFATDGVEQSYGSGYVLRPGLVLTAYHVVSPTAAGGTCDVRLLGNVLQERRAWVQYDVCWKDPGLDLALIRRCAEAESDWPLGAGGASDALARLAHLDRVQTLACMAVGFPVVQRHGAKNDTSQVDGKVLPYALMQSKLLQVAVEGLMLTAPENWKGLSGSALFCAGRLVAVITDVESRFANSVFVAQPLGAVFEDAEFLAALGVHGGGDFERVGAPVDGANPPGQGLPWPAMSRLVYLVDRELPTGELEGSFQSVGDAGSKTRVVVCAIPGEPEHEHGDLIELFRKQTLPGLFPGQPGFAAIEAIDWPHNAETVGQGLHMLRLRLHKLLGIPLGGPSAASGARVVSALNGNDKPRAFYCELRASSFTPLQCSLVEAWLDEWRSIASGGLNDVVALFVCLVLDPPPPPKPVPFWNFWAGEAALVPLEHFAQKKFNTIDQLNDSGSLRLVRLTRLGPCERRRHLDEWGRKLEGMPGSRWLASHVPTVRSHVGADPFPLRALVSTLDTLAALGSLRNG